MWIGKQKWKSHVCTPKLSAQGRLKELILFPEKMIRTIHSTWPHVVQLFPKNKGDHLAFGEVSYIKIFPWIKFIRWHSPLWHCYMHIFEKEWYILLYFKYFPRSSFMKHKNTSQNRHLRRVYFFTHFKNKAQVVIAKKNDVTTW